MLLLNEYLQKLTKLTKTRLDYINNNFHRNMIADVGCENVTS